MKLAVVPDASSTNMDVQYLRSRYMPSAQYRYHGRTITAPDMLNPGYLTALRALRSSGAVKWIGGNQLTTVVYRTHQNTSCYWMWAKLNGLLHPQLVQEGQMVYIPDIKAVANLANKSNTRRQVSVVTI